MKNFFITAFVLVACHFAKAEGLELPVYGAGLLKVNSVRLEASSQSASGDEMAMDELIANVRIITGCQPTDAIVIESNFNNTTKAATFRVLGGSEESKGHIHCFAIGYHDMDVTVAHYPKGLAPKSISVNGTPVK